MKLIRLVPLYPTYSLYDGAYNRTNNGSDNRSYHGSNVRLVFGRHSMISSVCDSRTVTLTAQSDSCHAHRRNSSAYTVNNGTADNWSRPDSHSRATYQTQIAISIIPDKAVTVVIETAVQSDSPIPDDATIACKIEIVLSSLVDRTYNLFNSFFSSFFSSKHMLLVPKRTVSTRRFF